MLRELLENLLEYLLTNDTLRNIVKQLAGKANLVENKKYCRLISPENVVLSGPFTGMKYPKLKAIGSVLFPKILGSYEDELHPVIEQLCSDKDIATIYDIGCAEGYYAIGFAKRLPNAKVWAFDTDDKAKRLCTNMAIANNVADKVSVEHFCSAETLANTDFKKRSLVISDCEGYEIELFTPKSVANLKNAYVLIELHDCFNDNISKTILPLFKDTHQYKLIKSRRGKKFEDYSILTSR